MPSTDLFFVVDVRARFDELVDEPDLTWLTVAQRRSYLHTAYDEFRRYVRKMDPHRYIIEVDIAITGAGANSFDLALATNSVRLLGNPVVVPSLTGPRLREIDTIGVVQGNEVIAVVDEAQRITQVLPSLTTFLGLPWAWFRYRLVGSTLMFDTTIVETLRMYYVGASQVDWDIDDPSAVGYVAEFIDDLDEHHEIIALLGAERYLTRDGSKRPEITNERERLQEQLYDRLQIQRNGRASRRVNDEYRGG